MPDPVRIVLSGATGRMGQTLARLIHDDGAVQLLGGIGKMPEPACEVGCPVVETPETAGEWIRAADVVIDFSAPQLLHRILEMHGDTLAEQALVVGTTGLGDEETGMMEEA